MIIKRMYSPNGEPTSYKKEGIEIHKTGGVDSLEELTTRGTNKSAHFLVPRNEDFVYKLDSLNERAWTAGVIYKPSARALKIMKRDNFGRFIKPGHYLIQIEVECLFTETYTENQYRLLTQLSETFDFEIVDKNLLTHKDTCAYKPDLEKERSELLRRINAGRVLATGINTSQHGCELRLKSFYELKIKVERGEIILSKK